MKEAGILVGNLKETNLGVAQPFLTTNSDHFRLRPKSEIYIPKRDDKPLSYGSPPPPQAFDRYSHDSWTYGLNRRDELLLSIFFLFYSFLVFCNVISASPFWTIFIARFSIYIILWFHVSSVTSVNLEKKVGMASRNIVMEEQYTLFWISFAVVFGLLVFGS